MTKNSPSAPATSAREESTKQLKGEKVSLAQEPKEENSPSKWSKWLRKSFGSIFPCLASSSTPVKPASISPLQIQETEGRVVGNPVEMTVEEDAAEKVFEEAVEEAAEKNEDGGEMLKSQVLKPENERHHRHHATNTVVSPASDGSLVVVDVDVDTETGLTDKEVESVQIHVITSILPPSDNPITQVTPDSQASLYYSPPLTPITSADSELFNEKSLESLLPTPFLLPLLDECDFGKKCLVLDLDETLVHSSFEPTKADFIIPINIFNVTHNVYVAKRPGLETFLDAVCDKFEVVIFTASLCTYANPVIDQIDPEKRIKHRLFRESCIHRHRHGSYVKDLHRLGRDLNSTLIIDNSPYSYSLNPENALPIRSWFSDPDDLELIRMIPFLDKISEAENVVPLLRGMREPDWF